MGTFRYPIQIGTPDQGRFEQVEAWVDSGAAYTWIPAPLLRRLGHTPRFRRRFRIAHGRFIEREVGLVPIRIGDEVIPTLCVFGDARSEPLLGAFTLEGFGLGVDPVNRTLVPVVLNML